MRVTEAARRGSYNIKVFSSFFSRKKTDDRDPGNIFFED